MKKQALGLDFKSPPSAGAEGPAVLDINLPALPNHLGAALAGVEAFGGLRWGFLVG